MRALGVEQHLVVQLTGVVGAQRTHVAVRPREVDRCLVAGRLADLGRRAVRPDRLADVVHEPALVRLDHRLHGRDDSTGVAPELAHVEQRDLRRSVAEQSAHTCRVRLGHGDRHRCTRR
jgi:hypothetical protein